VWRTFFSRSEHSEIRNVIKRLKLSEDIVDHRRSAVVFVEQADDILEEDDGGAAFRDASQDGGEEVTLVVAGFSESGC
jgi:hypothetical protein